MQGDILKVNVLLLTRMFKSEKCLNSCFCGLNPLTVENVLSPTGFLLCFDLAGKVHSNILMHTSQLL